MRSPADADAAALLGVLRGPGVAGRPARPAAIVADEVGAATVRVALGDSAAVFGPAEVPGASRLEGDPTVPGDELALGEDLFVQVESYAGAEFAPLAGPTLLRVDDDADLAALLEDLDAAGRGERPPLLADPTLQLADRCGLAGPSCGGPAHRLFADSDGRLRVAAHGPSAADLHALAHLWSDGGCAATCASVDLDIDLRAARAARPWLGRLLVALDLEHELTAVSGGHVRVTGFSGAPDEETRIDRTDVGANWPLLALDERGAGIVATTDGTRTELRPDAAVLVDAILATGGSDAAARAAQILGVDQATAAEGLRRIADGLARTGFVLPEVIA